MLSVAFFQSTVPGTITPGPPIKAVAGAAGDPTQVICNATPSVVASVSTLGGYCTTGGVVVASGTWRMTGSGGPGPGWTNGSNSVTFMLVKGATQPADQWQVDANGTVVTGSF